jgi:hypothetical protein
MAQCLQQGHAPFFLDEPANEHQVIAIASSWDRYKLLSQVNSHGLQGNSFWIATHFQKAPFHCIADHCDVV